MAVCNIFKPLPLEKGTGTFLLFSQYSEDLIREATESEYYRVTPSKFIAAEIDYSTETNESITKYLQDMFENGCAVCRDKIGDSWTPTISANLFWGALFKRKWLNKDEQNDIIDEIKFVGDINMQSYNEHNGMGYSEVFCYIPTDSKCLKYKCIGGPTKYTDEQNDFEEFNSVQPSKSTIEGYNINEIQIPNYDKDWAVIDNDITYHPLASNIETPLYSFSWDENANLEQYNVDKYRINTIIVLYDIQSKGIKNETYHNIPMGIYFTGPIIDNKMTNEVVKYVSNPDIYGSGSSYGLKICSRFSITSNHNIKNVSIETKQENEALLSHLLSEMSKSQSKMDDLMSSMQENIQDKKDFISIFKNSRVNVPYIKPVGNKYYWFVNGRKIGVVEYGTSDGTFGPDTDTNLNGLLTTLDVRDVNGEKLACFDKSEPGSNEGMNVKIIWRVILNNKEILPNELTTLIIDNKKINLESSDVALQEYKTKDEEIHQDSYIEINIGHNGMNAKTSTIISSYWPVYFGGSDNEDPTAEDIKNLEYKNAQPTKDYIKTYSTIQEDGSENYINGWITYAYPTEGFERLEHIIGQEGNDYIDDFNHKTIDVDFNGTKVTYNVYVERNQAAVKNYTLKFS